MSAGGFFTYAGRSSRDFGILIDQVEGIWDAPERDCEMVEVPGRNGSLTIDGGRWQNVNGRYVCGIGVDFQTSFEDFRAFAASLTGYNRLEDSWHPFEYRMAKLTKGISPTLMKNGLTGEFDVEFSLMPQRFLKTGEMTKKFTASGTILNATRYTAKPLLRVYGTGTLTIGGVQIQITTADGYTDIDCDICECYKDNYATNCNGNVVLTTGYFPELPPGDTGVTLGSGITRVDIIPRWWTL